MQARCYYRRASGRKSPRPPATSDIRSASTANCSIGTKWFPISRTLSKTSDKIRFEELGKTAEGRPFIAATISSAATLRNLDHYREIQAKLADPRSTTLAEAARLISEGKTVVLITCSIHATEVASTHSAIQFVYNLLTQDTPKFRAILDNVIIVLVPSQNPDGLDIVTRWYRKTLGTPYEGTSPPELYQKYVGHDNNRDWYIFSQPETRLTGVAAKCLASANRLRRSPARLLRFANVRSAVAESH